jgi:hypothetical protein
MSNANYAGYQGSPAQAARGLAVAYEAIFKDASANPQFLQQFPFLEAVVKRMKGGRPYSVQGSKLTFPVWPTDSSVWTGFTRAQERTTAITAGTGDPTLGEVQISKYYARQEHTFSEMSLLQKSGPKQKIDLIKGRAAEVQNGLKSKLQTDMCSSQDAAENIVLGVPFALATGNTVHGISQSNVYWRANLTAIGGVLTLARVDADIDFLQRNRGANPTHMMLATTTQDLYSKAKDFLGSNLMVTQPVSGGGDTMRLGQDRFIYRGIELIGDHFMPAGEVWILDANSWMFHGDLVPVSHGENQVDTKPMVEHIFECTAALICKSPRSNFRYTGATAV